MMSRRLGSRPGAWLCRRAKEWGQLLNNGSDAMARQAADKKRGSWHK